MLLAHLLVEVLVDDGLVLDVLGSTRELHCRQGLYHALQRRTNHCHHGRFAVSAEAFVVAGISQSDDGTTRESIS